MKNSRRYGLAARLRAWHGASDLWRVFNTRDDGGKARLSLLAAGVVQSVIAGTSGGIFYTGLLVGYDINIVNISILAVIPSLTSLGTVFAPYLLERFKKRRVILSVSRIVYYLINIVGITLLPELVADERGRVVGLAVVLFVAGLINSLSTPGYSTWHMSHIVPEVRLDYFSVTTLVNNISSSVVLVLASLVTDSLSGDVQLRVIVLMRWLAFAFALLDVYFYQKPKEPVYESTGRPSLLDFFRLPLLHKKFRLTMLIFALYTFVWNISASVVNAWLLDQVHASYLYINVINALYALAIVLTSSMWSRRMRSHGTFRTLAFALLIHMPTYLAYAFVDAGNYLWLMTLVRLVQHGMGIALTLTVNNLLYINTPKTDQTNYVSFYIFTSSTSALLGVSVGTAVVAAMGEGAIQVLGRAFYSGPVLLAAQGVLMGLLAGFIMLVQRRVEPDKDS